MWMILYSLLSLSITRISGVLFGVVFQYLHALQSHKVFYIFHSPALALVDEITIYLHIQFQFFFTGASVLPVLVSSQDRTRTGNMSDTFNFLFAEPA